MTQGGYGSAQIIDRIDYDAIARNPKILPAHPILPPASGHRTLCGTGHVPRTGQSRFNTQDLTDYTKEYFFKAVSQRRL